ncbi:MAG: DUF1906 domain-containing protein [Neomegalonema sp.]|nr:DUF1906 domain-containing protein [Neomegalonema sp.]
MAAHTPQPAQIDRRSWLRGALSVGALGAPALLVGCKSTTDTSAPKPTPKPAPEPAPAPKQPALRKTGAVFPRIADAVTQLNPRTAAQLRALGVETIFRYYSYVPSNIAGKDLTPSERDAIFGAGLSIGVVFQHYNNCFDTFANDWGKRDAEQALKLAEKNAQPKGSAIYFGVDGDFPFASMIADQIRYMRAVAAAFAGSGFKVGVYGGGCTLDRVRREGLAEMFWLSGSTGFTGTKAFYNQGDWTLYQNAYDFRLDGSVGMDTNWANPKTGGAVGQWNASGVVAGDAAKARKVLADRRFARRRVDIRSAPRTDAAGLGELLPDRNARAIAEGDGWTEIVTREGGDGVSLRGFVETGALSSVERFTSSAAYGLCGVDRTAPAAIRDQNCSAAARAFRK